MRISKKITVISVNPAMDKLYTVENFQSGGMFRAMDVIRSAGGKGLNVARVVKSLDADVSLLGFKAGSNGNWIQKEASDLGIDTQLVDALGETRCNINVIDVVSGTETEVLEIGHRVEVAHVETFCEIFEKIIHHTDVLVCSGSLCQGLPSNFYRDLIQQANKIGVKTILDSSGEPLRQGIKAMPTLIKPNMREFMGLLGREPTDLEDTITACQEFISNGVQMVVVSMGKGGALLVTGECVLMGNCEVAGIVNSIGSGDAMVAAFAVSIANGQELDKMFQFGLVCATANTQSSSIGCVDKMTIKQLMNKVQITKLQ